MTTEPLLKEALQGLRTTSPLQLQTLGKGQMQLILQCPSLPYPKKAEKKTGRRNFGQPGRKRLKKLRSIWLKAAKIVSGINRALCYKQGGGRIDYRSNHQRYKTRFNKVLNAANAKDTQRYNIARHEYNKYGRAEFERLHARLEVLQEGIGNKTLKFQDAPPPVPNFAWTFKEVGKVG